MLGFDSVRLQLTVKRGARQTEPLRRPFSLPGTSRQGFEQQGPFKGGHRFGMSKPPGKYRNGALRIPVERSGDRI